MRRPSPALVGIVIGTGITIATVLAIGWLYAQPAVTPRDIAEIRGRATRLLAAHRAPTTATSLSVPCRDYHDAAALRARAGIDGEPASEEHEQRERAREACADAFRSAWDSPSFDDVTVSEVITIGLAFLEDEVSSGPEAMLSWALRTIWILDSLHRAGVVDTGLTGRGGVRWMTTIPSLASMRAITEEEAARVRAMLDHVRASHPSRLQHPERFALALYRWDDAPEEPLEWVCRAGAVELAERLAALDCESRTTRDCLEHVVTTTQTFDLSSGSSAPSWAPWLPPRLRRGWDAHCPASGEDIRELAAQAVAEDLAFALFDELIAHSLTHSDIEETMRRPPPTFEGEPIERVVVREPWGARIAFLEPSWVGRRDGVLQLGERRERRAPPRDDAAAE